MFSKYFQTNNTYKNSWFGLGKITYFGLQSIYGKNYILFAYPKTLTAF